MLTLSVFKKTFTYKETKQLIINIKMKISLLFIIMSISTITATEDIRRFRGYMGAGNPVLPLIGSGRFNKPTYRSPYQARPEYRSSYPAMTIKCILYGYNKFCYNHYE